MRCHMVVSCREDFASLYAATLLLLHCSCVLLYLLLAIVLKFIIVIPRMI